MIITWVRREMPVRPISPEAMQSLSRDWSNLVIKAVSHSDTRVPLQF